MRVLTAEEMRSVDRFAIEELGIPGMVLMENAAIGVVDAIAELFARVETVAILVGPGNNGGDGLAIARHLVSRDYRVRLFLAVEDDRISGDAGAQLAICRRLDVPIRTASDDASLAACLAHASRCDLVVDALFGTGLTRPLEGTLSRLVSGVNRLGVPRLAVDLPSGLDASRAELIGPCVDADLTVTFAALKVAHVLPPAAEHVGHWVVTDLGLPADVLEMAVGVGGGSGTRGQLHLLTQEELATFLAPRPAETHKGSYGHVLLVAGSRGKSGAAVLGCRAALRAGAGLVTAAVPDPLVEIVDAGCVEAMTLGLPHTAAGVLAAAALEPALAAAADKAAVGVGPGLGTAEPTCSTVRALAQRLEVPLILDADAVNAFAPQHGGQPRELRERAAATVLTPHPGELARLLETSPREVQADRRAAVRRAAELTGAVVLLKGHRSLIATPEGETWINTTGNPGMASAGSGDVLTGVLTALAGQGYDVLAAAQLAAFLHGFAGDLAAGHGGEVSLTANDVVEALPFAFEALRGEE